MAVTAFAVALRKELHVDTNAPKIQPVKIEEKYGRFIIEPLPRGYGSTIGNSLRRVLLSSIQGAAVTSVKIEGVQHEFSVIPGVYEDATDIILNLKNLAIKIQDNCELTEPLIMRVDREGQGEVTAADFEVPPEIEIMNRGEHVATLNSDGHLRMEMVVESGTGYVPAESQENASGVIGEIAVSSIFTPVPKVSYIVEPTRVGHKTDLDRLTMEIWTNGTVNPNDALSESARILDSYFKLFFEMGGEGEGAGAAGAAVPSPDKMRAMSTRIEDLDFSVRTSNCLRNQGIETLADLLQKSEDELLSTRHFGKKSLTEVKEKLDELGLQLTSAKPGQESVVPAEDEDEESNEDEASAAEVTEEE